MTELSHTQKWRLKNPEKARNYKLKSWYGITLSDYQRLFAEQNGKCLGCHIEGKLQLDHSHETGKVRGLLCFNCNNILARSRDSIEILQNLVTYLNNREERLKWLVQIRPVYELRNKKNNWRIEKPYVL